MLNLSRGMSYKAALAGLDLGGGKAVIIGDPADAEDRGRCCAPTAASSQSLDGRYYTACDVGTYSADMDHIARECDFVTGRTVAHGGAGDSSVLTAYGVFQGMRAAAEQPWGEPTLAGRTVGVAGVGKVGRHLVRHLIEDGADGRRHRRARRRRSSRCARSYPQVAGRRPTPTTLVASDARRLRPLRAGRRDHRRGRRRAAAPRSSAARPTTSSPTPASRSSSRSAASSTRPTTA